MSAGTVVPIRKPRKATRRALKPDASIPPARILPPLSWPTSDRAIAWGQRDEVWGRATCLMIERAMPPTPWVQTRRRGDRRLEAAGWLLLVLVVIVALGMAGARR